MLGNIYPWQANAWQQLMNRLGQMPHALLLYGQPGIGKLDFARALAAALLCHQRAQDGSACGYCKSCHWLIEGTHPDMQWLQPELQESKSGKNTAQKRKQNILVDQIRALSDFVHLTSHQQGGKRIVLIAPADTLNIAASNALLKILEEPSGDVMFILVTDQIQRLLPTVLSRCVKMSMPIPSHAEAKSWLKEAEVSEPDDLLAYHAGSPLSVVSSTLSHESLLNHWKMLAQGDRLMPAELASKLIQPTVDAGLVVVQKWLYDLILYKQTGQLRYHPSQEKTMARLSNKMSLKEAQSLFKSFESLRKASSHPLNHELQVESLLLEYIKLFSR